MILEALHTKINAVINAYATIGDIDAVVPFAVYSADQAVLRSKGGIEGYEYTVRISVVSESLSECLTKSWLIKTAIESLIGTTTNGTTFDIIQKQSETQRPDTSTMRYINDFSYLITTQNP